MPVYGCYDEPDARNINIKTRFKKEKKAKKNLLDAKNLRLADTPNGGPGGKQKIFRSFIES